MSTEFAKAFEPKEAQKQCLQLWAEGGYFHAEPDPTRKPYTIVIPPPNVTGALHLGHALNNTLQDVLIRYRRMQGYNALYMPGTDHAGIATQAVVERLILQSEKKTRHDLGREALVERIWQWKEKYEQRILGQLRELGTSCDWARTRFTLDEQCARAVRETFFRMFRDGYIYRGKRLVNWDTQLQTSVADDETYTEDIKSGFWTFRYPVTDDPNTTISFSTTRPETMLGDSALCVHPGDARYQHLIGKTLVVPLNGREIPIIADGLLANPELGTGCVKVTPAHDPNDYACWQRNPQIAIINILNPDGTINDVGGDFSGLDRYKAREAVVKKMEEMGYYVGREDRIIPMKYSDRSKSPIEPYLSDQWFVKMADRDDGKQGLAQMALDAVTSGKVKFFPDRYSKMYLDWLGEKRDWCVSRQLWWGHRIPVWYTDAPESEISRAFSGRTDVHWLPAGAQLFLICAVEDLAGDAIPGYQLRQDTDVLDTWFSSALWPHSTLGWPEDSPELKYFYPTSTLVTSRDIITLWVARMVLAGMYNVGDIPFQQVYVHPKLLDGFGETMSKSKGNGIDPLDIIDLYGTDALRYGMVNVATETQDSRMPVVNVCPHCGAQVPVKQEHMYMRTKKLACPQCKQAFRPGGPWPAEDPELPTARQASDRFELGRNFANKLWNATRFLLMNLDGYQPGDIDLTRLQNEDCWILSRLSTTVMQVTAALEEFRFAEAAKLIYEFSWTEFCDWYIEISKGRLSDPDDKLDLQRIFLAVLDTILRLAHPIMPFVTESLWQLLNQAAPLRGLPKPEAASKSICIAAWPSLPEQWQHQGIEASFARMQELIRGIREVRNRYQIEPRTRLNIHVKASQAVSNEFMMLAQHIGPLAGLAQFELGPDVVKPKQSATMIRPDFELYIPLEGLIDPAAEAKRLEKQIADAKKQLLGYTSKLANESYLKNAPAEVVAESRTKASELQEQIRALEESLQDMK